MSDARPASAEPRAATIQVRRTARYYLLGGGAAAPRQIWLVCHGYGQLARDFIEPFAAIATRERLIVAPEALNRYYLDTRPVPHGPDSAVGVTWMTREDRENEIADYVAYLDALSARVLSRLAAGAQPRLIALGFSQGAATVSRWAAQTTVPLDELVLWAGLPAPELELPAGAFDRAALTIVVGDEDLAVSGADFTTRVERLRARGLVVHVERFAGGHRLDRALLQKLASAAGARGEEPDAPAHP